ncbi:GTP-binding protein [uncultured Treponema sp.]|uniref:sulfate adenylyltransferase subunit 1 n=1 Tax=uncultured Treponema sp. TaxID=162155 RepID=UPI0025F4B86D|nr:GTP-binding protein [uncultured Treponema sp.]
MSTSKTASKTKGLLKFITCGSVDDGKSTLIGHILYDAKLLYADQEQSLQLESKVGSRGGKIDYSLLLDGLMAEREQGITIDVAYRYFSTEKRSFIVADTPGHEEYTRNMAVGASFADLAIILVDAVHGVLIQTRRHARICSLMGIKHFIFAVNKMDLAGYGENRFNEVKAQINQIISELSLQDVVIIPVSATEGDNITKESSNMTWYKGKTILSQLESVETNEISDEEGFYMPVQRVCRPNHEFRGFMGQIERGSVKVGDEITTLPSGEKAKVKKILAGFDEKNEASRGKAVNIVLDREVDVSRGCVFTKDLSLPLASNFTATILWMDDSELERGKNFFVKIGSKQIPGLVTSIEHSIDVNTGAEKKCSSLKKNEIAVCGISVTEPIVLDLFKNNHTLGEFILIDRISNMTSACGVVTGITNSGENQSFTVDRDRRAALKLQSPLIAQFILGQNGVTEEFVASVEKKLADSGRHTYRYMPKADEDYISVARHLYEAGLVVLLELDARQKKEKSESEKIAWYENWQENLSETNAGDVAQTIRKKTAFVSAAEDYSI